MQSTRQWRLSSTILAAFLFFAIGMGVSAGPAWALEDENPQPQATTLPSANDSADLSDGTLVQEQQDFPSTVAQTDVVVADASNEAGTLNALDPSQGADCLDTPGNPVAQDDSEGAAVDSANIDNGQFNSDDSSSGLDDGGSADDDASVDGVEGESPPSEDGVDQGDNPFADPAEEGEEIADGEVSDGDVAASEEDLTDDAESSLDSDLITTEAESDEAATQESESDQNANAHREKTIPSKETVKDAQRVTPSGKSILKARNRVIWALLNGKKNINLEGFKLRFSRMKDLREAEWYIAENAVGYLGYTTNTTYSYDYKNGLYVLTGINFTKVKKPSQAFRDALDDMVSWAPEYASTAEKVKAVHDWLVRKCSYNNTAISLGRSTFISRYGYDPYSAESALLYGGPVCQGYSAAFNLGMTRLGITCETVGSDDHAWNRVYIDGAWFNVDVTWDDSGSTTRYFMKSDSYFLYYLEHPDSNTSGMIKRPGNSSTYDYASWNSYWGSSYHGYVWDYKIASSTYRMATNSMKRLGLKVTDGSGEIPYQDVRWSSSNKGIAVVTADGYVVSCGKHGKVRLTCNVNGTRHSCTVWVVGGSVKSKNVKRSLSAKAFWYDGKKHVPTVTVKERTTNGTVNLRKGTDYTVTYLNSKGKKISASQVKKRGTYYVLIKGKGLYSGTVRLKFQITKPTIAYRAHVQNIGWQGYRKNGKTAGTSGRSLRVEAIQIKFSGKHSTKGSVQYRTHVQNRGWETKWRKNGKTSGTSGKSLRLEAIQIKLTGDMAKKYDVYYRTHVQNKGWLGWAKNGQRAGSAGYSYRMEAIQVVLVKKGAKTPGSTRNAFVQKRR